MYSTTIRIQNKDKNDFVSLQCPKWLNDLALTKRQIKKNINLWNGYLQNLEDDILTCGYTFDNILLYFDRLDLAFSILKSFPSIDLFSSFFVSQSLNLFHYTTSSSLNSSSKFLENINQPDINCTMNGNSISYSGITSFGKLLSKIVDKKEYFIIKVSDNSIKNKNQHLFLKCRGISKIELTKHVLALPEFWRNYHFVTRNSNVNTSLHSPFDANNVFYNFYQAKKINKNKVLPTKKEIFDNIRNKNPFELTVSSFATHLMFSLPGLIMPLTQCETLENETSSADFLISLNENEVNLITINSKSIGINPKLFLDDFSDDFSKREHAFASYFELSNYNGGKFIITNNDEIGYIYETNMVEVFDSLTKYDNLYN